MSTSRARLSGQWTGTNSHSRPLSDDLFAIRPRREKLPCLGVKPRELPGGHSPFLARPAALADELLAAAAAHGLAAPE
jgi:hypothetical protein